MVRLELAFMCWEGVLVGGSKLLFISFDCCCVFAFLIRFGDGRAMWREVETGCWVRKMIAHVAFVFCNRLCWSQEAGETMLRI